MTKVTLHGELARRVGRAVWMLEISTPMEALRAIEANTGKVIDYLGDKATGAITEFRILINEQDFKSRTQFVVPFTDLQTLDIMPVLQGSAKGGVWQTIIGAALLVFAWYAAPAFLGAGGLGLSAGTAAYTTGFIANVGFALAVGGIAQLVSPSPKVSAGRSETSAVFNGPTNSVTQGNPVPLGYGRMMVGSQVISFGVRVLPKKAS